MIGWLWRVIVGRFGCAHEWETETSCNVYERPNGRPVYVDKHLRCKKCGDWKKVRL